ncbi:MAG: bacterio-opsin activator domain-containing protein [Haloferacaceae archaeon]
MVTIITEIRIPADQFPLGRIFREYPDIEIELERIVPTDEAIIPLFWTECDDERAVEETLRSDPLVEAVAQLTRTEDRILYSVDWSPDVDALVETLVTLGVDVLSADGTAEYWAFRLQFRERADLNRFRRACRDHGIDVELLELFNPLMPSERGPLTAEQKDVLATAYENGYWDVPRTVTQQELADLIGIIDSVLSRRLRDGVKLAVELVLYGSSGKPYESVPPDESR